MPTEKIAMIEVLICAYNDSVSKVLDNLPSPSDGVVFLVSHQISPNHCIDVYSESHACLEERDDVRVCTTFSTGLSNNRNNALRHASGELVLIADDDVTFQTGWSKNISEAFLSDPDADVITFRVNTPEGQPFKDYYPGGMLHTRVSLFRVASIEIAARRLALVASGISFDANFGLNAKFTSCEETVFLSDLKRQGLILRTSDKVIATHPKESSGSNYAGVDACIVRGAVIRRVFGVIGLPLTLIYAIKHHSEYKADHSFLQFCLLSMRGFFSVKAHENKK